MPGSDKALWNFAQLSHLVPEFLHILGSAQPSPAVLLLIIHQLFLMPHFLVMADRGLFLKISSFI